MRKITLPQSGRISITAGETRGKNKGGTTAPKGLNYGETI